MEAPPEKARDYLGVCDPRSGGSLDDVRQDRLGQRGADRADRNDHGDLSRPGDGLCGAVYRDGEYFKGAVLGEEAGMLRLGLGGGVEGRTLGRADRGGDGK